MKNRTLKKLSFIFIVPAVFLTFLYSFFCISCGGRNNLRGANSAEIIGSAAGDSATFSLGRIRFDMRFVPGGLTIPVSDSDYGIYFDTVDKGYWIADTEVTYELWKAVYDWAVSPERAGGAYTFANKGRQGADASPGSRPVGTKQHPVTNVSWRDAMIWCNALTERFNAETGARLECVYFKDKDFMVPLRSVDSSDDYPCDTTPGTQDNPYVNENADGFRLPAKNEWILAARYRGEDSVNTEERFSHPYFTKSNSASGAVAGVRNRKATGDVAWYYDNSGGSTKPVGTAGIGGKKPGKGNANALGLYDMSGNVSELSFDWFKEHELGYCFRTSHSGSWAGFAELQKIRIRMNIFPYAANNFTGFRFARTQK